MKCALYLLPLLLIVLRVPSSASEEEKILEAKLVSSAEKLLPGGSTRIAVQLQIHKPWHVNGHVVADDFLIPTVIEFTAAEGISFGKIDYPAAQEKTFAFSENPVLVYEETVYAFTTVAVAPHLAGQEMALSGVVSYQACNNEICLPPAEFKFSQTFPVAGPNEPVKPINEALFGSAPPPAGPEMKTGESDLIKTIESKGIFWAFAAIFLAGLALNLTPCVYPLIPITISYFGGQAGGKKGNLLLLSLVYVIGMAITYSVLGVAAALTGSILGAWLQNPWVLIFIALVMVALALSMFGLYEIRVPAGLANFAGQSKQGYFGTLFMGLTVGIIAAPCIGPFVLGLLTYVGEKGDPLMGFLMFFVLALGLGVPFIFLAIFGGALKYLPRSGGWMEWIRKIFGFILIGMAFYFINPLFKNDLWYYTLLALTALLAGIYLGWIDATRGRGGKAFPLIKSLVGILFILAGAFFWVTSVEAYVDERLGKLRQGGSAGEGLSATEIAWQVYSEERLQAARAAQKPVMIDFYADWCIPCKELDRFTFTDPRVIEQSKKMVMLKADLTHSQSEEVQALQKKYNVKGVPTLVFLSPSGEEIASARVVSYVNADKFLGVLESVLP